MFHQSFMREPCFSTAVSAIQNQDRAAPSFQANLNRPSAGVHDLLASIHAAILPGASLQKRTEISSRRRKGLDLLQDPGLCSSEGRFRIDDTTSGYELRYCRRALQTVEPLRAETRRGVVVRAWQTELLAPTIRPRGSLSNAEPQNGSLLGRPAFELGCDTSPFFRLG